MTDTQDEVKIAHSLKSILRAIPNDWPITSEEGVIRISPTRNGPDDTLQNHFMHRRNHELSMPQADALVVTLEQKVALLNAQTQALQLVTHATRHPVIAMDAPSERSFAAVFDWHLLRAQAEASGAIVKVLESRGNVDEFRDVWTRDQYLLAPDGTAILPPTISILKIQELNTLGVKTKSIDAVFEGGDVLQHRQTNTVFVGIPMNADGKADEAALTDAHKLANTLHMQLAPVLRTKSEYYHLDTMMSVLPDGSIILVPDATDEAGRKTVRAAVKPENLLELTPPAEGKPDERLLATNIITLNGNVLTANARPEITAFLAARGLRVVSGPFQLDNSGPHCQINMLQNEASPDSRSDLASLRSPTQFAWQPHDTTAQISPLHGRPDASNSRNTGRQG